MGGRGSNGKSGGSGGAGKVSVQQANEDWFEYEYANAMAEYIQTGKMPKKDMYGNTFSPEVQQRLKSEAEYIQNNAEITEYKTLHRGMVLSEAEARSLTPGDTYTMRTLTATSPNKNIASIYTNIENAGGQGVSVMFEIQRSGGNKGYKVNDSEVVIPKGTKYRVTRNYMDKNGVVHVSLYASKKTK